MDTSRFQSLTEQRGMRVLPKRFLADGNVLLAEKFCQANSNVDEPHWEVMWAVERNGCDIGRILYIGAYVGGIDVPQQVQRRDRITLALRDAKQFIADSKEVGRYG